MIKKPIHVLVALLILITIASVYFYFSAVVFFNSSNEVFTIQPDSITDGSTDLTYRLLTKGEEGAYYYHVDFDKAQLPQSESNYAIIIYRLAGQSYKVLLNDVFIGSVGDYEGYQSSIWNTMYSFQFDTNLLQGENTLKFEVQGLYDIGLVDFPVIVTSNSIANIIMQRYRMIQVWAKAMSLGVLICCAITLLVFYQVFDDNPRRKTFLYLAWAIFIGTFYFIDFFTIDNISIEFILYKKINVTAIYVMIAFITLVFSEYFGQKKWRYIAYITIIVSVSGAMLSRDMFQYKSLYDDFSIFLPLNALAWVFCVRASEKKSIPNRVIAISVIFATIFLVPTTINIITGEDSSMFFSIIHIMLLALSLPIITIIATEIRGLQQSVYQENKKLKELYQKSIRDGSTGLFNYPYMLEYLNGMQPIYSIFLIDMDNLKEINDEYGHIVGNKAILIVTETLQTMLSENSIIGRFGGDEFIVMSTDPAEVIKAEMDNIRLAISQKIVPQTSQAVTVSIGMYVVRKNQPTETIVDLADKALYQAKYNGKNRLIDYDIIK